MLIHLKITLPMWKTYGDSFNNWCVWVSNRVGHQIESVTDFYFQMDQLVRLRLFHFKIRRSSLERSKRSFIILDNIVNCISGCGHPGAWQQIQQNFLATSDSKWKYMTRSRGIREEARVVCLDISKAFDRVWHPGLLVKLRALGFAGKLLHWLADYLWNRSMKVILNGKSSSTKFINAGVPQGSILGPSYSSFSSMT